MKTTIQKSLILLLTMFVGVHAGALPASYYAKASVLSSGKWVKIAVSHEGIQQITPGQLREWGFNDPSKVKVYGYGGTALCNSKFTTDMPDDLVPATSMLTDDGRVLFYGIADVQATPAVNSSTSEPYKVFFDRNTYSTKGYYFLTDDDRFASAYPEKVPYSANSSATEQNTHLSLQFVDEDVLNPAQGGAVFMGPLVAPGKNLEFTAKVRDYSYDSPYFGSAFFRSEVCAVFDFTKGNPNGYYQFNMSVPKEFYASASARPSIQGPGIYKEKTARRGIASAVLKTGEQDSETPYLIADGDYNFKVTVPNSSMLSGGAFDRAFFIYPRQNRMNAEEAELTMFFTQTSQGGKFVVEQASPKTCVWTINSPTSVAVHTLDYDAANATVRGSFARSYSTYGGVGRLVAFEPDSKHFDVEFAGEVANQNLHGLDTPHLLIITTPGLLEEAENLAQLHRDNDGIDVAVVTQDRIFNEFGSGTPSAHAYRRLAKMFYDRDNLKFKNLLLYGAGSWDNRNICTPPMAQQLLTYQAEYNTPKTSTGGWDGSDYAFDSNVSFSSDDWFGMIEDNYATDLLVSQYTPMRIGVGRMPLNSVSDARSANEKVKQVMQNPLTTASLMNAVVISDTKDSQRHDAQAQQAATELLAGKNSMTVARAHTIIYPRDRNNMTNVISNFLNRGTGYFTYCGHGGPNTLGMVYPIWSRTDVDEHEYTQYPFAMLSTCDTYAFDREHINLATDMVMKNDGGMMGVIGAGRTVEMGKNQVLNLASARVYSNTNNAITMGELYRNIVNNANSGINTYRETRINTMSYNLCGDPALVMNFPSNSVVIDALTVDDDEQETIMNEVDQLSDFTVSGYVKNDYSQLDTNFNGTATVTLYESPRAVDYQVFDKDGKVVDSCTAILDETPLVSVIAPVVNGKFSAKLVAPFTSVTDGVNRVVVAAYNPTSKKGGVGVSHQFKITDNIAEPTDIVGPEITELYLDSPDFVESDPVDRQVTVYATVHPGTAGISPNAVLGAGTKLTIDDVRTLDAAAHAFRDNGDGTASLAFKVARLADGHHTLTLSVADALGNRDSRSLSFIVNSETAPLALEADRLTARESIEFALNGSAPQVAPTLIVRDSKGNTVHEQANVSMPCAWSLRANGKRVDDGIYHAFLRYPDSPLTVVSECSFTVIK